MQKTLLLLVIACLSFTNANSQCCPYLGDIYITPDNPSDTDSTFLVTNVTTPNQGAYFGYEVIEMPDNNIRVEACYFEGFFTALQMFYDSINLGVLSDGNYTVDFVALSSVNDLTCMPTDSTSIAVDFEVEETTNTNEKLLSDHLTVSCLPNPVTSDVVRIVSSQPINKIEVFDAYGKVLLEKLYNGYDEADLDISEFASGVYFIRVEGLGFSSVEQVVKW